MINYSLTKRSASSLSTDQTAKYYAKAQVSETIDLDAFAKHIASHGTVYSRADVYAILMLTVDCLKEMLLEGKKVSFGDLGSFYTSIQSKGEASSEDFSTNNITKAYAVWSKGRSFKNFTSEATYKYVATRAAQEAVRKAQKAGQTSVTLSSGSSTGETGNSGDSSNTDNSSNSGDSGNTGNSGNSGNSSNTTNVTVTLTSEDVAKGKVQVNGGEQGATAMATVASGSTVTIKAISVAGYDFLKWSDNNQNYERTLTPTADMSLTAYFEAE